MPSLYLPPSIVADERQRYAADLLSRVDTADPVAQRFTALLRRIDPLLRMVRAKERIEPGTPLVPGYYHVLRFNEHAPISVFTLHDNGAFAEPNSRVFDRLAAGDLHDPRVMRALKDVPRQAALEAERERNRERVVRRDELRDRVNAAVRTQISMDTSVPWTQNAQGRRESR